MRKDKTKAFKEKALAIGARMRLFMSKDMTRRQGDTSRFQEPEER